MWTDTHPGRTRTIATTIALLTLTGCTTTATGTPTPGTTPSPPSTSEHDPTYGAPPVTQPLDATRFLQQPCTVLTEQQLTEFSATPPGQPTTTGAIAEDVGPWCVWIIDFELDEGTSVGIGFLPGNQNGLADWYRIKDELGYFEPITIDGYPALFAERGDHRHRGSCNVLVGITDKLAFRATEVGDRSPTGACQRAKQLATAALTTIKASN